MIKILFVCWGNICRSPMAEFIMKDIVNRDGMAGSFKIDSAAVSTEDDGHGIYRPARAVLASHGIGTPDNELGVGAKRARQITSSDYRRYDLIIGMDDLNMRRLMKRYNNDPDNKIIRLMDLTERPGEVDDPWYTRDFETAFNDIHEGCESLYEYVKRRI